MKDGPADYWNDHRKDTRGGPHKNAQTEVCGETHYLKWEMNDSPDIKDHFKEMGRMQVMVGWRDHQKCKKLKEQGQSYNIHKC